MGSKVNVPFRIGKTHIYFFIFYLVIMKTHISLLTNQITMSFNHWKWVELNS